jgi:5-oxoprolinase (ATP-hydrolysing)
VKTWRFWVDTGGTFTDCIALDPAGGVSRVKLLSSGRVRARVSEVLDRGRLRLAFPMRLASGFLRGLQLRPLGPGAGWRIQDSYASDGSGHQEVTLEAGAEPCFDSTWRGRPVEVVFEEEAPVVAMRLVTGAAPGASLPPLELRLATTRGTNALLERKGARVAFFVTRGFGDLIVIGNQARPELFALDIVKAPPLYASVVEVEERLGARGEVLVPLELAPLEAAARQLVSDGHTSAAIALLHAYREPSHELALARALRDAGFAHVSCSSAMAPVIRVLPRAQTAIVDAYLGPIVAGYLRSIRRSLSAGSAGSSSDDDRRVLVMTSAGGLVPDADCLAKDCLLSGPAGGMVGAAAAAGEVGCSAILSFDMGGTSTDVARFAGELEYVFEQRVGDAHIVAPALHIETVAAGGGSVCWSSEGQLKVGPHSAGAAPGPACYGAGGPLTVTDVNLLLGRLDATRFEVPLVPAAAEAAAREAALAAGVPAERRGEMLEGFLRIANERMAEAIRRVSVQRGYDPADHTLLPFGGAGAQHACAVATALRIPRILVPVDASLLSALGLGRAALERFAHRQVLAPLEELVGARLDELLETTTTTALELLRRDGVQGEVVVRRRIARLRFAGQESTLDLECGAGEAAPALAERFRQQYRATFGTVPSREVELESLRVSAAADLPMERLPRDRSATIGARPRVASVGFGGRLLRVPVYDREGMARGFEARGPALVVERRSCTVVEPGWSLRVHETGCLLLAREGDGALEA